MHATLKLLSSAHHHRTSKGGGTYLHTNEVAHVVDGLASTLVGSLEALTEPV